MHIMINILFEILSGQKKFKKLGKIEISVLFP